MQRIGYKAISSKELKIDSRFIQNDKGMNDPALDDAIGSTTMEKHYVISSLISNKSQKKLTICFHEGFKEDPLNVNSTVQDTSFIKFV